MSNEENRTDVEETKPAVSSRLGKEAKIGVTVIVVLLVVLGVVVTARLKGSSSDDKLAAATASDKGKQKPGGPSTTDAMLKETKSTLFGGTAPTLVSAKAAPATPPKTTVGDLDQWKLPSDRDESKRAGNGSLAMSAPPSFMPDPPEPSHADQREPRPLDPPAAKEHEPRPLDPPAGRAMADASPLRGVGDDVRLVAPGEETPTRSVSLGPVLTEPSSHVSASATPAPPAHRENSPLERPTAVQPSASSSMGRSFSAAADRSSPALPVAQYGSNDYRRESTGFRQNSGVPGNSVAASSYTPLVRRDDGKYEVQPNDSLWTISEKLYGTGAYFKALAQHNRGKEASEDRLKPGELILAPAVAQLEKSYPDLCPKPSRREALQSQSQSRTSAVGLRNPGRGGRTYTVVEGDTLFNIARYELGKASRWAEIYELNRDVLGKDFNYLTPGTQLALPEGEKGEKSDVIAQPPSNSYRR